MQTIAVICGGISGEHEVSLISAKNIVEALDRSRYRVLVLAVDKQGRWLLSRDEPFLEDQAGVGSARMRQDRQEVVLAGQGRLLSLTDGKVVDQIDVAFPIIHGTLGEDGTLQGLLRQHGVPFTGPDVLGSAVCMDKDLSKRLLQSAGLPVSKGLLATTHQRPAYAMVSEQLGTPVFVKPCNLGSSLAVSKVRSEVQYHQALAQVFKYDRKALIEEAIQGREVECSVLGNEQPEASKVMGEIVPNHDFYSYEAKYIDEKGAELLVPAKIEENALQAMRQAAVQTFQVLEVEGMARVDFFLKQDGSFVINELNTLPGFTNISMYPKLWEASGMPYRELLTKLIELGIQRAQRDQKLRGES